MLYACQEDAPDACRIRPTPSKRWAVAKGLEGLVRQG